MPQDPSRPSSWKGDDRSASSGARRPGQGAKYSWKSGAASGGPPSGRKLKAGFFSLLGILVVAGLAWLVYQLLPTRPTCVTVVASDPRPVADNLSLPLNIYGHRDARDFLAWANSGDRAARKWCSLLGDRAAPWPVSTGRREDDWLKALADRKEDGIILYLSQPGGTDDLGKPFLFDEQGGHLEIAKLLLALKPVGKKKLLILDAAQTPTDWRNGILVNQFADGLKKLEPEIASDPNLLVLCASSPGQRSWVSEEFGRSVFAHFLMEGLSGGAIDGKSGPITPADLLPFVRKNVDHWVQRNRADSQRPFRQEPFMLPSDEKSQDFAKRFTLAYGDPGYQPTPTPSKRAMRADDLQKAWETCDRLAAKVPGSWVNSPRGWRRYRELLLRYELALRAGDDESASKLSGSIASLAVKLDADRAVAAGDALSAGLSMPAALGRDVPISDVKLSALLDSKDPLAPGLKLLASGGDETVPRLKLIGYMLKLAVEKPDRFSDIANRIGEIDDGGASRPTEAHLAVMLARNTALPGSDKPASQLVRLALEVRRLAEEALLSVGTSNGHPYSERLSRQLADDVIKADRDRRHGEDLLFAAVDPHHAEAQKLLQSAKLQYEQVRVKAAPVRRACEVRDAVFADLPFLTEWAALDVAQLTDVQQRKPEALWKDAHSLADRVSQLDPLHDGPLKTDPTDKDLAAHTEDVWTEFTAFTAIYRGVVSSLIDSPESTTQSFRQRIECVLAVPGPVFPAADRIKLVTRAREVGFKLAQGSQTASPGNAVTEVELAKNVPRYAKAIIGKTVFDGLADSDLKKDNELPEDASLSRQLAGHWKKLRTETDLPNRADGDKSVVPLHWRERLGLLSGTAVEQPREPSLVARDERWKIAFRRLAHRAEIDHWYEGNDKPFSDKIAKKYLKGLPEEEANQLTKQVEDRRERGRFRVQAPPERILTTEREFAPVFKIAGMDASFEPGLAAVAPRMNTAALEFKALPAAHPVGLDRDRDELVPLIAPRPLDSITDPPAVDLALLCYYRGQAITAAIAKLPIKPIPDLTVSRPPPPPIAQVAARADDDLDLGAIAIVFDCSGSMRDEYSDEVTGTKIRKIDAAKNALAQFERKLPTGALVSLWAYGHESSKTQDSIEQLLRPTVWDRANPVKANLLSQAVDSLRPLHDTPLVTTMIRAADDTAFATFPDNKTLLVLTDGCDQVGNEKLTKEHNDAVANRFHEAFVKQDRKVSIRMVMFRLLGEKAAADAQFRHIEEVRTPSSKEDASSGHRVAELLAEAMRPRVALYRNSLPVTKAAFIAKRPNEPQEWFPNNPPVKEFGEYEMRCRDVARKVVLNAGDRLALRIYKSSTGIRFARLLMADEPERSGLRVLDGITESAPFALGLNGQVLYSGPTTARAKFTLEDRATARSVGNDMDGIVRFDRPRWIWWEFKGIGRPDIPSGSTVTQLYDSQAPMWELLSTRWPLATGGGDRLKPLVEVWATVANPESADTRELPPGDKLTNIPVDSNAALLESAGFERIKIAMGDGSTKELECLVARIRSSVGSKYYIQVVGSPAAAEEHRYFNEARSSTHVFWLDEGAKSKTLRLNVINVDATKTKCTRLGRELVD
jgi:hypothetical protein